MRKQMSNTWNAKFQALKDPIGFVEKLQKGEVKLPSRQKIVPLPVINWEKYTSKADLTSLSSHRHSTRNKRSATESAEGELKLLNFFYCHNYFCSWLLSRFEHVKNIMPYCFGKGRWFANHWSKSHFRSTIHAFPAPSLQMYMPFLSLYQDCINFF